LDKENKGFPNTFSLKNFIYIKEMKDKLFVVDYNLKPTNDKDIINNTEYNKKQDITNVNTENENLKRTYDHAFSNIKNKYQDIKKNKIMNTVSNSKCKETRLNNKRFQNLTEIFTANHYKSFIYNIEDIIEDYSADDDSSSNNNDNSSNDGDDIIVNRMHHSFNKNDDNDNDRDMKDRTSNINEKSDINDQIDNTDEFSIVMNPFDNSKPNNLIEKYFDLKNYDYSVMESQEENLVNVLKKCFEITDTIKKKIKKIMPIFKKNKLIFNFTLSWCFYEIGIIYLIFYVDERKSEYLENAKYFRDLLIEASKAYLAVSPYLLKYNEMLQEAEDSVKNNTKKLVIKDIF